MLSGRYSMYFVLFDYPFIVFRLIKLFLYCIAIPNSNPPPIEQY